MAGFGLARRVPTAANRGRAPKNRGTPYYMAPELFVKDGVHSYGSDLWSLGCVLYELATGRAPFAAQRLDELMRQIQREEPALDAARFLDAPGSSLDRSAPPCSPDVFAGAIRELLTKDPRLRKTWAGVHSPGSLWRGLVPAPPDRPPPPQPLFDAFLASRDRGDETERPREKRPRDARTTPARDDPLRLSKTSVRRAEILL